MSLTNSSFFLSVAQTTGSLPRKEIMKLSNILVFLVLYGFCTLSSYEDVNPKGLTKLSRQRRGFFSFMGGVARSVGKFFVNMFAPSKIVTGIIPTVVKVRLQNHYQKNKLYLLREVDFMISPVTVL